MTNSVLTEHEQGFLCLWLNFGLPAHQQMKQLHHTDLH